MRRLMFLGVLVCVFLIGDRARADAPEPVQIVLHAGPEGATFTATGAINDSGSEVVDAVVAAALPAPSFGFLHTIRTFYGQGGSFTIEVESIFREVVEGSPFEETGHWVVLGGTGDYSGLHGVGLEAGTRDPHAHTLDVIFSGNVH